MRISDWSSNVCSSDLFTTGRWRTVFEFQDCAVARRIPGCRRTQMTATRSRAPPASVIQREPHLHRHLPVRDLAVLHVSTRVQDLEPADVANGLRRAPDGRAHGVIDAFGGGTGHLGRLVDVVAHGSAPSGWNASPSLPAGHVNPAVRQARQSPGPGLRACAGPALVPPTPRVASPPPVSSLER